MLKKWGKNCQALEKEEVIMIINFLLKLNVHF